MSAFTFAVDQEKKIYHTDFSVIALLKDQSGEVVQKLSRQYRLSGPMEKLDDEKKGRVLFYREADLMPGRYRLETVAYDAPTGRSSVRTGTIEVTASDEGKLRLSDVVILSRAEPANAADEKHRNPFLVGNLIVSQILASQFTAHSNKCRSFSLLIPRRRRALDRSSPLNCGNRDTHSRKRPESCRRPLSPDVSSTWLDCRWKRYRRENMS
jgi:hypothetical protein